MPAFSDYSSVLMSWKQTLCQLSNHGVCYIKINLFLQILMNAPQRGSVVETWQCVEIPWDHTGAFARKVLALMPDKANVMASVTVVTH